MHDRPQATIRKAPPADTRSRVTVEPYLVVPGAASGRLRPPTGRLQALRRRYSMGPGLMMSLALHTIILVLLILGLPSLFVKPPPQEVTIAVTMITKDELTRTTKQNPHPVAQAKPVEPPPLPDVKPTPPLPDPLPPPPAPPPPKAEPTPAPPPPEPKPEPPKPEPPPPPKPEPPKPEPAPEPKPEPPKPEPPPEPKPEPKPELPPPEPKPEPKPEPPPPKPEPPKPEPKPEPPKPEPPKPEPPKPEPKPEPPKPEPPKPEPPKPEPKPEPPKPEPPKPDPPKPPPPKPEPPKQAAKADPQKQKQEDNDFEQMLKNVAKTTPQEKNDQPPKPLRQAQTASASSLPNAPLGSRVTTAEKDMIAAAVSQCWDVDAGAKGASDLRAVIQVEINPDGTVRNTTIVDTEGRSSDPVWRAFAERARRAPLIAQCNKLPIPPEKYEELKTFTFTFSPQGVL
jgi:hypothetical protein